VSSNYGTIFSNTVNMTKKIFVCFLFIGFVVFGQKPQTIAYIDMEYILQNVPEYQEAEKKLSAKAEQWTHTLETAEKEIQQLKNNLLHEKILLTEELIFEREQEIKIKEFDLKKIEARYFGVEGSLYLMRKQLVQPIQDQVYNAIQTIVKQKKYDFVIDRSSELILLHANPKYDISKLVIKYINKTQKEIEIEEAKVKKKSSKDALQKRIETLKEKRIQKEKQKQRNIIRR
jgi:Skp family chaperone for outer membrane proteins